MIQIGTVNIETKRLLLRKIQLKDAEFAFKTFCSDTDMADLLGYIAHSSINDTIDAFEKEISNYDKNDFYYWGIELREINKVIGTISLFEINEERNSVEIGYGIGKEFTGKGYGKEILNKIIEFCFSELKVSEIDAYCNVKNEVSNHILKRIGFKRKDTIYDNKLENGIIEDTNYYLLKKEDFIGV